MQDRLAQMDEVALAQFIKRAMFMTTSESGLAAERRDEARARLEAAYVERTRRNPAEQRRYSRHQLIGDLTIVPKDGASMHATSFEISVGGISAATVGQLTVGEQVTLSLVLGRKITAIVRRKCGAMYGFEFVAPTAELQYAILVFCEGLPLFKTTAGI